MIRKATVTPIESVVNPDTSIRSVVAFEERNLMVSSSKIMADTAPAYSSSAAERNASSLRGKADPGADQSIGSTAEVTLPESCSGSDNGSDMKMVAVPSSSPQSKHMSASLYPEPPYFPVRPSSRTANLQIHANEATATATATTVTTTRSEMHTDVLLQEQEYYFDEETTVTPSETSSIGKLDTPPSSLNVTPTGIFSRSAAPPEPDASPLTLLPPAAAAAAAEQHPTPLMSGSHHHVVTGSSVSSVVSHSAGTTHRPVLYSAIGSLEDPSSGSYNKAWWKNHSRREAKFEFPSTKLIPPQAQQQGSRDRKPRSFLPDKIVPTKRTTANKTTTVEQQGESTALACTTSKGIEPTSAVAKKDADQSVSSSNAGSAEKIKTGGSADLEKKPSNLRTGARTARKNEPVGDDDNNNKKVRIATDQHRRKKKKSDKKKKKKGPVEMFRPSSDAYTPRMGKKEIKYKPAEMRTPVQQMASGLGTLSRPNFRDALRRVAMIIHQHVVKIEQRFEGETTTTRHYDDGLFHQSMKEEFSEENFASPKYKCTMVRVPMARSGMVCGLKRVREKYRIPTEDEIYEFAHKLFKSVQLSSECSIVCLIYVERLMEVSKVPLLATTWRPIFMCGLLLASKVWQDLSSWNIEFASVYPQYSLDSINRLELLFLRMVKWDLYISSSLYAKYYFALRSLVEKPDFRQRYNRMVGGVDSVEASEARKIEERSTIVKEEALLQLSRSM